MTVFEANFDGLVGPSHHYGGLAQGNLAAAENAGQLANPRAAALQGLAKMRTVMNMGLAQGWLPPPLRPDWRFLHALGFRGSRAQVLQQAGREAPQLLQAAYSAASMWTANAATVAPAADTEDGRVHLSVANLVSQAHRALEARHTTHHLRGIFADKQRFTIHEPLPAVQELGDEGAANHTRLGSRWDCPGVHFFVYGAHGQRFRARQTQAASQAIARRHTLTPEHVVLAEQSVQAIDAGVFHNDVICVGHRRVLLAHASAFSDAERVCSELQLALQRAQSEELLLCWASAEDFGLDAAVRSYVFNSQLLDTPDGGIHLLGPANIQEHPGVMAWLNRLVEQGVLEAWSTLDLSQSMRNGGGPACLRLRVPLAESDWLSVREPSRCSPQQLDALEGWVRAHYRDRLEPRDLLDVTFADELETAHQALAEIMAWPELTQVA
nr:N-succinylarginine dihydrolase [Oceanococcus sp. HetDA_MAG_MS8]